jgi:nucleoside-diphosphate-sugar epimerase
MNSESARFVITGASGYLGRAIFKSLSEKYSSAEFLFLQHKKPLNTSQSSKVEIVSGDLSDAEAFPVRLRKGDTIIHAAAATHADFDTYQRVNVVGTAHLISAAKNADIAHFVFISSAAAVPKSGSYGESKLAAEEIVRKSGLPFTIVRPSEIYGAGSPEGIAKLIDLVCHSMFVPYVTGATLVPLFADDAILAIQKLVTLEPSGKTYVLSGPNVLTFKETIGEIKKVFSKSPVCVPIPVFLLKLILPLVFMMTHVFKSADQVSRLLSKKDYDNTLAAHDLNFHPRSFREGLETIKASGNL